jgi:hypothetical protein
MQTFSVNSLAEQFEVDRGSLVKALRSTPPDAQATKGRATWKVSTAAAALEAHRRNIGLVGSRRSRGYSSGGHVNDDWQDPILVRLYSEQDSADQALRKLKTLAERRKAAIAMIPLITRVDAATRERGKANGGDPDAVDMRADILYQMQLRGLETPCDWTHEATWAAMCEEV